ncbi:hydrogenase maturation protease [Streptomyces sp. MST-110588]|uniref:hydrogenase maturation protease n=1 Tax=Streptomyces sp. MST-110588 TaxID=2833628 RepID=UPI001F5E2ED5|nr:hydrogenase maturation protease [Streptomyces sp. MST-110588]UNO43352.1 hydrogenase maturation protease [Streptomyces sp. MST-110588]
MTQAPRIAVIGVGNTFRHDDGIGPAVVRRLRERTRHRPLPPSVTLADCDGDPGRLMSLWEGTELAVVVDAAHAHPGRPGRVHRLDHPGRYARPAAASSHGLGLGEAVQLSDALGRLPGRLVVLAVEGADRSLGTGLTPAVAGTVDRLADAVEAEIVRHRDARARHGQARARGDGRGPAGG